MRAVQPSTEVLAPREHSSSDESVLNWLSQDDFGGKQRDLITKRQPGTGSWFINSTQYQRWLSDAGTTELICPGIPGAGKTMIAAIVVDDLLHRVGRLGPCVAEPDAVLHLYCSYERQDIEDINTLLSALLKQLLSNFKALPDAVRMVVISHMNVGTRPTLKSLREAILTVATHFRRVWIVLDALDECENEHQHTRDGLLLEVFSMPNAKVLGTCRPVPDIISRFADSPQIEIRAQVEDVQAFVDAELALFPDYVTGDSSLRTMIQNKVVSATAGIFLLARLQLDLLRQSLNISQLHKALADLPTGQQALQYTYAQAISRIETQSAALAHLGQRVLGWLSYTYRPIHAMELQHALAVNLDPGADKFDVEDIMDVDTIISSCAGLVTIDTESSIIRLVHYTTQEYLESIRASWLSNARADVILTCLAYCSLAELASGPILPRTESLSDKAAARTALCKRIEAYPFLPYAATALDKIEWEGYDHRIRDAAIALLENDTKVATFWQALNLQTHFISPGQRIVLDDYMHTFAKHDYIKGIHYVATAGEENLIIELLSRGCHGNIADGNGRTPLSYAAANGHVAIVSMLVGRHDVDPDRPDNNGLTPLSWAAQQGQDTVAEVLLETGKVNPNCKTLSGSTPLTYAALRGHLPLVQLLLELRPRVKVNHRGFNGMTPLQCSIVHGHTAVTRALLEIPEIDPTTTDLHFGTTALSMAAKRGCAESVRLLLDHRPPPDLSKIGGKVLLDAAQGCHVQVLELLLKYGVNPNASHFKEDAWIALRIVAGSNLAQASTAADLLLAHGASVDAADAAGQTPLIRAAWQGTATTIKVLLQSGANLERSDNLNRTPLSWAAQRRNPSAALCLLQMGAEVKEDSLELLQKKIRHVDEFEKKYYTDDQIIAAKKISIMLVSRGFAMG